MRQSFLVLLVSATCFFAGPVMAGGHSGSAQGAAEGAMGGGAMANPFNPQQMPDIVALKAKDVENMIGSVKELKAIGIDSEIDEDADMNSWGQQLAQNNRAMNVLDDYGFNIESFQEVAYSIAMAMGAAEMKKSGVGSADQMQQQKQMMEQLKGQMNAQQFAQMQQQLAAANQMMEQIKDQPPGNIALVEQYRSQLEAL